MIIIDHFPYGAIQGQCKVEHSYCKKKKHNVLKIPTRQRQTSWLYTAHGEGVELRMTKKHSKVEGLNAGSSENESNATTTQPHGLQ